MGKERERLLVVSRDPRGIEALIDSGEVEDATSSPVKPKPLLEQTTYEGILRIVRETRIAMERLPAVYRGKDEESIRDHFVAVLSTHFQSATGETFRGGTLPLFSPRSPVIM